MLRHLSPLPSTQHSESKDLYDLNSFTVSLTACMHAKSLQSCQLFATPWTVAQQAPLSKGFSRQEFWNGLPYPPPGELPRPRIQPTSPVSAGGFLTIEPPGLDAIKGVPDWSMLLPGPSASSILPSTPLKSLILSVPCLWIFDDAPLELRHLIPGGLQTEFYNIKSFSVCFNF